MYSRVSDAVVLVVSGATIVSDAASNDVYLVMGLVDCGSLTLTVTVTLIPAGDAMALDERGLSETKNE